MYISTIKASDIQRWQNSLSFAPKTVINYRSTLNIILEMAFQDELINRNPLKSVKPPKKIKEIPFSYKEQEVKQILSCAQGQMKNLLQFAFFSGVRPSELIALEWKDINFSADSVTINKRVRSGTIDLPKGYKVRIIDLLPQAKEALLRQKQLTGLSKHIWVTQYGTPYNKPEYLSPLFKEICKSANVRESSFYDATKNTFCTLMLEYGQSESWLTQQVGHENISVTRTHYIGKLKPDLEKLGKMAI